MNGERYQPRRRPAGGWSDTEGRQDGGGTPAAGHPVEADPDSGREGDPYYGTLPLYFFILPIGVSDL